MAKKNSYITEDLQWLRDRAQEIKEDVESMPYDTIEDRTIRLSTTNGSVEKVVATKEQAQKARREAYKDYAALLEAIDKLARLEDNTSSTKAGVKVAYDQTDEYKERKTNED